MDSLLLQVSVFSCEYRDHDEKDKEGEDDENDEEEDMYGHNLTGIKRSNMGDNHKVT